MYVVCMQMNMYHVTYVEVKRQLYGVDSLLPPLGLWESNSGPSGLYIKCLYWRRHLASLSLFLRAVLESRQNWPCSHRLHVPIGPAFQHQCLDSAFIAIGTSSTHCYTLLFVVHSVGLDSCIIYPLLYCAVLYCTVLYRRRLLPFRSSVLHQKTLGTEHKSFFTLPMNSLSLLHHIKRTESKAVGA